jgi:hypothetical protein
MFAIATLLFMIASEAFLAGEWWSRGQGRVHGWWIDRVVRGLYFAPRFARWGRVIQVLKISTTFCVSLNVAVSVVDRLYSTTCCGTQQPDTHPPRSLPLLLLLLPQVWTPTTTLVAATSCACA